MPLRTEVLERMIERRGWSRTQAAAALGLSEGGLSLLLAGRRQPSEATISRLLRVLRAKYEDLFDLGGDGR